MSSIELISNLSTKTDNHIEFTVMNGIQIYNEFSDNNIFVLKQSCFPLNKTDMLWNWKNEETTNQTREMIW